jgi:ribosomal protein L11 methyltransferase
MKPRTWYEISIQIQESYQDLLIGQLALLGFTGFVQEKEYLICYITANKWTSMVQEKLQKTLERFKLEFPIVDLSFTVKSIREKNWNKTWEKQTGIVEATPQIIIKPSWKKLPKRHLKKIVLHIDPKMSFGTGHHETTRLSLSLLELFLQPDMKVLDFGCGTGVLGIACVKLGSKSVLAIDNDPWAIENTRENIQRNYVQRQMKTHLGSISAIPRLKYDLIVANIDYRTISRFLKSIVDRIHKDGVIILSGILTSDMPALLPLFKKYLLVQVQRNDENEWTAVALRRNL